MTTPMQPMPRGDVGLSAAVATRSAPFTLAAGQRVVVSIEEVAAASASGEAEAPDAPG